jgi:hypothetical protein
MTVVELKARVYDLLAMQQHINAELQQLNQQIAEESKPKEEKKAE